MCRSLRNLQYPYNEEAFRIISILDALEEENEVPKDQQQKMVSATAAWILQTHHQLASQRGSDMLMCTHHSTLALQCHLQ